jgi:hypothetical protein
MAKIKNMVAQKIARIMVMPFEKARHRIATKGVIIITF